ncbi:leucine-rich repeat domain-containing protein [Adonisia turfae]|uniref:non-specific serine/threonine protein kinase n=1 Tax=Adonisia turfae CCMR0081 TaxID=2292702 RepID=A0A6M0RG69_9CYAN|nr:leucine-rich repeat domain-containing protein [Adonisia turfae]NEZ55267.1 TIR domain-containing protein [Adonisia turfae CCMR0081]
MTQDELLKLIDQAAEEGWTELDLAGADLTELPPEIGKLSQLETLILAKEVKDDSFGKYFGNSLTKLPAEIGLLKNLKSLIIFGNWRYAHRSFFPSDKPGNQLTQLPLEISQLKVLQNLDLRSNQLTQLPPEIGQLTSLQNLDLRSNQLTQLPPEIIQLTNLQNLDLRSNQLTQLPPEIGQLTSLTQLDLSSNQLTQLPPEIGQLTNLQNLNLSSNQLTQLPPEIIQLTSLTQLYLSSNQLTQLPPEIIQLTSLTQLYLSSNQLTQLPPEIVQLTSLTQLYLSSNQLTQLPPQIVQLTSLTQLDLSANQFTQLPPQIVQLTSLTQLYLSENQLTQLPPQIVQLTSLTQLYLSENQLTQLPPEIVQLTSLTQLDLRENQLTQLPPEIVQLTSLTQLYLSANQLTQLPPEIVQLTSLTQLDLSANQLTQLPPEIVQLTSLTQLDLSENQLTQLPPEIVQLTSLTQLYLSANQLTQLPPEIVQLTSLTRLYLRSNQLTQLPPQIVQLTSLTQLDLRSNQLTQLPPQIVQLKSLQYLNLQGNPIPIPPEILKSSGNIQAILDYYFQVLDPNETEPLYESKFIIVGEGGAGKTTLAKKLIHPNYEIDSKEESTEGIDVIRWEFEQTNKTPFRTNIWDFGGQEIYHATHQFFLTKRSLYALVVDARQENTDFYYWLNIVSLLSDNSPVFIIKNEKQDRQCDVNERALRGEFTNLEKVFATNLADNRGLDAIKESIQKRITQLDHVGTPLPKVWVRVRSALENYATNCNYITIDNYRDLCRTSQLTDRNRQNSLSNYLHDLGVILHFHEDPILKHYVILKPEWGTAAVYDALDTQEIHENFGRFTREQLNTIWEKDEYSEMRDELLQLMMRFKLCYEIPGCANHYIAPQLLSPEQPDYPWDETSNLILRYRYDFMPKGILTRLIVELHEYIENQTLVWKTGVVFTNGTAHAEVTEHYPKSEIRIRVSGTNQKRWLSAITHELEKIHRSYEQLKYKTLIPCNCEICKDSQTPHDYPYQRLQKFLSDGQYQIQCQESYKMVDVRKLLDDILYRNIEDLLASKEDGVFSQRYTSASNNLQGLPLQPNDLIRQSTPTQMYQPEKEVFISYAWGGDSEDITNKVDEALKATSINLIRDKRDLGFKGRIKDFMQQIGKGKAVIVIISDKYLKSENCMFELVEIAASGNFDNRIFPIVLDDAQIYKPIKRIRYIQHWEKEKRELDEAMNTVGNEHLQGFRESIDLYTRIRTTIAELTETLKDMNTLTPEIHTESGFTDLINAIEKRLES